MAEKIDGTGNAQINNIRFSKQTSHPSSPAADHEVLYIISGSPHGGLYLKDSDGKQIGPFITGTAASSGVAWTQVIDEPGTSFTNWTAAGGTWSSDGTVIKQTDTGAVSRRAKYNTKLPIPAVVFEAEIQIRSAGATRVGGLLVSFDGTNQLGLSVYIDEGNNNLKIEIEGGQNKVTASNTIDINTWYKVRMVVFGDRWTAYLDNVIQGTGAGGASSQTNDGTYLGIWSYQAEVWFRNIKGWVLSLP